MLFLITSSYKYVSVLNICLVCWYIWNVLSSITETNQSYNNLSNMKYGLCFDLMVRIHILCTESTVRIWLMPIKSIFTSLSILKCLFNLTILMFETNSFETWTVTNLIFRFGRILQNIYHTLGSLCWYVPMSSVQL
jgi:hypothetical protein